MPRPSSYAVLCLKKQMILRSKVTGARHEVVQVVHVVDARHPRYNPRAAAALTPLHDLLRCYACHAAWNFYFLSIQFPRNYKLFPYTTLSDLQVSATALSIP